jgi:peptide chain release factor 1
MLEKLLPLEKKYLTLREQSMDTNIISDTQKMISISKEISAMQEIFDLTQAYKKALQQRDESKEMINTESDPELLEMAKEDLKLAEAQMTALEEKIKIALLPKDPNDDKNIFLEIRPAA